MFPPSPYTPVSSAESRGAAARALGKLDVSVLRTPTTSDDDDSVFSPASPETPLTPISRRDISTGSPLGHDGMSSPEPFEFSSRGFHLTSESVGKGAFSKVFKAYGPDNQIFAVKARRNKVNPDVIANEADILSLLNSAGPHDGVIRFHGWYGSSTSELVLDFYEANLLTYVNQVASKKLASEESMFSFQKMSEPVVGRDRWLSWASQLAKALKYIHSRGVVHGDLKPDNILIDSANDTLVIADFSSAFLSTSPRLGACSSIYSAPDVRNGAVATFSSDTYVLGLVLLFCATGSEPYSMAKNPQQRLMWQSSVPPLASYDPESQQRLKGLTKVINACFSGNIDAVLAEVDALEQC